MGSAVHVYFSPFGDSALNKMAADKALLANQAKASGIHTYKNTVDDVAALLTRLVLKDFS